jgi:hypothetical protein
MPVTTDSYLVFKEGQPREWCYFTLNEQHELMGYYTSNYSLDSVGVEWSEAKTLDPEERLYALDLSANPPRPVCLFAVDGQLYKSVRSVYTQAAIAGNPQQARVTAAGDIHWSGSAKRLRNFAIDVASYPSLGAYTQPTISHLTSEITTPQDVFGIEDAYDALQVKQCIMIANRPPELAAEGVMQVWQADGNWHYQVTILGQEKAGIFDGTNDVGLIAYFASQTPSTDDMMPAMGDLRYQLSRPYLQLTLHEQKSIFASMRFEWPINTNWSLSTNQDVLRMILQGGDFVTKEILPPEVNDEIDSVRISFRHRYLIADKIDEHFKTLPEATISAVLQFNRYLLQAALRELGGHIATLQIAPIPDKYNVPCGSLMKNTPSGLDPNECDLFCLIVDIQRYNLDQLTDDVLPTLRNQLLGIIQYESAYQAVSDNLLVVFREGRSDDEALGEIIERCNTILLRVNLRMYINGQIDVNTFCQYVNRYDELCTVLNALDAPSKTAFICALGEQLNIIEDYRELSTVLYALDAPSKTMVIQALSEKINTIIQYSWQLSTILNILDGAGKAALIQALGEQLNTIIKDGSELSNVLNVLDASGRITLIQALGEQLNTIIKDGSELSNVLNVLDASGRITLIRALGEQPNTIIKNDWQLSIVLNTLDALGKTALIQALGEQLNTIIKDGSRLLNVLIVLDAPGRITLIRALGEQLTMLMKEDRLLSTVLNRIDAASQTALIQALGEQLNTLIKDHRLLSTVLNVLDATSQIALIQGLSEKLNTIIKGSSELLTVLNVLDALGKTALIQALGKQLNTIIETDWQLCTVLQALDATGKTTLIQALGKQLQIIIKNDSQLSSVLYALNAIQASGELDVFEKTLTNRTLILFNLGCSIIDWSKNYSDFKVELKEILAKDQSAFQHHDIYNAYHVLLNYILDDKHTRPKLSTFFAVSMTPKKLEAATWLLALLTKEDTYTQATFDRHQAMFNDGELQHIFQLPAIQACIMPTVSANTTVYYKEQLQGLQNEDDVPNASMKNK